MTEQNNFGVMSKEYDSARRGYPDEVFKYLKSLVNKDGPITLDLGCGTGISTRQLKQYDFEVAGVDKDSIMIDVAKEKSDNIPYFIAPADKLPFESNKFDLVTAFTSFHWFNNEESLLEIKRVIKEKGIFFAVLKANREDEKEDFKQGYFAILKKYSGDNFDTTKDHYKKEFLKKVGFSNIIEKSFYIDEKYTVEDALILLQSLSLWNLVEDTKKPEMLKEMKEFYENHLVNGFVIRSREISTFIVYKNNINYV